MNEEVEDLIKEEIKIQDDKEEKEITEIMEILSQEFVVEKPKP